MKKTTITARQLAFTAVCGLFENESYSNILLDQLLKESDLSQQDKSFCSAIFYGIITRDITLTYIIEQYCTTPVKKLDAKVLALLKLGIYQLKYMDNVPESAAVNETVNTAKLVGLSHVASLINGVLRSFIRGDLQYKIPKDKLTATSVQYSVPMPLISLWRKSYGPEKTAEILEGINATPPMFLRVNTSKTTVLELLAVLEKEKVNATVVQTQPNCIKVMSHGGITRLDSFKSGLYHVQDLSSQICSTVGGIQENYNVLDICSAPGGKSFTMAEQCTNGKVVSCDLYPHRLTLVEDGASRLGISNITTVASDATKYNQNLGEFDLVLCDVVCSGFGIVRRKPEIKYKPLKTLDETPNLQYNIISTAYQYVKDGGRLIYSTCTLNPAENEQVVEKFLENHKNFILEQPMTTIFPTVDGGDGFFYSILKKTD